MCELDWASLMRIWDQFRELRAQVMDRRAGKPTRFHVSVTGGEPFVRADAMQLLETIAAEPTLCSLAVLCNGLFIDDTLACRLAKLRLSYVQVSIDGSEATHDQIRGEGAHARAVSGIRHLTRHGVPVMLSFTATRENYSEFADVARLGASLGVRRVWADRCIPLGRGASGESPGPEETQQLLQSMHRESTSIHAKRGTTEIAMHRALQFLEAGGLPYRCTAGSGLVTVLANGDVCPCRRMPIVVGNVIETPLSDIYWGNDTFQRLRDNDVIPEGCERCFYSRTCRGGLRCLSYATYGTPFVGDPGCWLRDATPDRVPAQDKMAVSAGRE